MAKAYFTHDSDARNSSKMIDMRSQLDGMTAAAVYGVYWMMVERLRDEENYACTKNYKRLAFDFRVDEEFIRSVVEDYCLFDISEDGKIISSHGLRERMELMDAKSAAGKKGAESRWKKNRKEMAQNGTSMADCESANGKVDANKIKLNKTSANNSTCDFPSLSSSTKAEERREIGEEEKEKILFDFVFEKNLAAPGKELELFWEYNNSDGRDWSKLTDARKEKAIRCWRQVPKQEPRFKPDFLAMWREVYKTMKSFGAPRETLFDALSDDVSVAFNRKYVVIYCSEAVARFLENEEVILSVRPAIMKYAYSNKREYVRYDYSHDTHKKRD